MSFEALRPRLASGRPLVLDADTCACFRARGTAIDVPGAVGQLLRSDPDQVLAHYQAEVRSQVSVLTALTADTAPRALAEVGMEHRSARLTGLAVELAFEAAERSVRPVAVAGALGSAGVSALASERARQELVEHAERLAVAGCELIIARGQGSRSELMSAVEAGARTQLPTWAVLEVLPGSDLVLEAALASFTRELVSAGASAVLFEVSSVDEGISLLEVSRGAPLTPGVLLASSAESVRGFPDSSADPVRWAARALELDTAGARVIGGGAGTTENHTAALVEELLALHPSIPPGRA